MEVAMWEFFKRLGFRKADEMDGHITRVSVGWSWLVILVNLLGFGFYGVIRRGEINVSLMILSEGLAVYFGVMLYMRGKLYDGPQE